MMQHHSATQSNSSFLQGLFFNYHRIQTQTPNLHKGSYKDHYVMDCPPLSPHLLYPPPAPYVTMGTARVDPRYCNVPPNPKSL